MTSNERTKEAWNAALGTMLLVAAFVIVLLEMVGSSPNAQMNVLAVLLAITGSGLRLEAAVTRR
ncbi:hypothetical protein JOF56_002799 [Kibdelosporangium banguiense]|uniref:Uncharacterized protein n=1 Tax=Kibdelosporangium banguiense TaxID=1365924 RepID=A0ABS4TDI4_9PSEU|nr:hypothetical protein [Kibdelosporangium banguiense]MBP2322414.1 hypothetical protein [Kibdelosporangium banguiense]